MYDIVDYGRMIADPRTGAYAEALQARIRPGAVVLDIGTGPGIMALLACRFGAAKVYAIEPSDVIQVARELAAANGFASRVHFVQAMSADVDLPEKVDGIVSDLHGVLPLLGKSVASILDARNRFLRPGGWMIPTRETMWAALVSSPALHDPFVRRWETPYGFDLSKARAKAVNAWRKGPATEADVIVEPRCWYTLDYQTLDCTNVSGEVEWTIERGADAHGLSIWFDSEATPGIGFSNSPASTSRTIYEQAFFPWPVATSLVKGDRVRVRVRADFVTNDYMWSWDSCIADGNTGEVRTTYRQSSLLGMSLSLERLRKRERGFVPEPSKDARIDRYILELMDQKLTLDEISQRVLAEFPTDLTDWRAALTRAGNVSERYSR